MVEIGIYYYPWYNTERWKQHDVCFTPSIGYYNSNEDTVIDYHVELIKYVGVDFVVIEMLPMEDWSFSLVMNERRLRPESFYDVLLIFGLATKKT